MRAAGRATGAQAGGGQAGAADEARQGAAFLHVPVMSAAVVELLVGTPEGLVVDATVGGGGHAAALLDAMPHHALIGIDRDEEAVRAAKSRLASHGARAVVAQARFDGLAAVIGERGDGRPVTALLFDLGVSSYQLDEPSRGFSYRFDGPLDMRMDRTEAVSAAEVVNGWPLEELARLFAANGEPRFALRIARAVVRQRPVHSTGELAELVLAALPAAARRGGGHPARRVFQAVRIAVNDELGQLDSGLRQALELIAPAGRIAVISYHSGEDRLVKARLVGAARGWCSCPPQMPCVCGAVPQVRLLRRGALKASPEDIEANPRARSARLRAVERLDVDAAAPPSVRGPS
ncbi:MAG: 16S rRNA (cytosine(1402)-N(4))-methyltransferase RsmH [Acidimicrobiales bacterium]